MKLQSLKISNTLLIKKVIHYINITTNQENNMQNTTKNLQNDLNGFAYDFDFATLKLEIDKSIKTKKTLKNTDQYPKHTQNLPTQHNLILSSGHRPNFDG